MAKLTMLGQFVQELSKDDGRPYDFICNNYTQMSKGELATIIKECICVIADSNHGGRSTSYDELADSIICYNEEDLEVNE